MNETTTTERWCAVCEALEGTAHPNGKAVELKVWGNCLVCTGCAPLYREGEAWLICSNCCAPAATQFVVGAVDPDGVDIGECSCYVCAGIKPDSEES